MNLKLKLEKLEKEIAVQEKSLNIIGNPEVIDKLKNKVNYIYIKQEFHFYV